MRHSVPLKYRATVRKENKPSIGNSWLAEQQNGSYTYLGKTCQPGSASCGWGRSSWYDSGAGCTAVPPRWLALVAGTCGRGVEAPAAAVWVCVFLGRLLEAHHPLLPRSPLRQLLQAREFLGCWAACRMLLLLQQLLQGKAEMPAVEMEFTVNIQWTWQMLLFKLHSFKLNISKRRLITNHARYALHRLRFLIEVKLGRTVGQTWFVLELRGQPCNTKTLTGRLTVWASIGAWTCIHPHLLQIQRGK